MSLTLERNDGNLVVRLEGELTLTSATELKSVLIEALAEGRDLRLDLERVDEIDITALQLLWAAGQEAARGSASVAVRLSEAAGRAARDSGFEQFPGLTPQS